jgi:hypothetical protein
LAFEGAFGIFRTFFNEHRVARVENIILKVHFDLGRAEAISGHLWLPLATSVAVVLLCFSLGNWRYSETVSQAKDIVSYISILFLSMASFTFFGHSGVNNLLDKEREHNESLYKMALADEQRSVAEIVATRELYYPLTHLDAASLSRFEMFFREVQQICKERRCFADRQEFSWRESGLDSSISAFRAIIGERADEDCEQLRSDAHGHIDASSAPVPQFGLPNRIPAPPGPPDQASTINLAFFSGRDVDLLRKRPSSMDERNAQAKLTDEEQRRANKMAGYGEDVKRLMTVAFSAVLSSMVPDADGIIGAYVGELIDDVAEWIVRPEVDRLWNSGYRPEAIQDLKLADAALPDPDRQAFKGFHAAGTRNFEVSKLGDATSVENVFDEEEKSDAKMRADIKKMITEAEKREREREIRER